MEIIHYVMKEFLNSKDNNCSRKQLTKELQQLGYNLNEIDYAFNSLLTFPFLINDNDAFLDPVPEIKPGQRIFSPAEQKKLSLSFQSEIVRLANYCLLSYAEIEKVLFEAMQLDTPEVGLRELELILHKVIKEEERISLMLPYKTDLAVNLMLN